MERLSPLDASFLYLERPETPMHISSLAIYEGPPPPDRDLRAMLARRLGLVPRFRQRLASVPFGAHRPAWIDDEQFDLDTHLQHIALFEPSDEALMQLVGRILSQPLCRTRPLWEMWLITGLQANRFAILSKTHHCLWDGISGVDLHAVLLDDSPEGRPDDSAGGGFPDEVPMPEARPQPSGFGMLVGAARDRLREATRTAKGAVDAALHPQDAIRTATKLARDATSFASSLITSAPTSDLNGTIGSRRRYAVTQGSLNDAKDLRHTLGASVNDVVLAAVAGGLRSWQLRRGEDPHDVRVMVPVSVRNSEDPSLGNRVAMVVVPLPVTDRTALMRLDRVHSAMEAAKRSGHVAAGEAITRLSAYMPPAGIALMSRAQSVMRPFNLLVTNIPGPQFPLYLLGRKMLELYPQAPLAANQGLAVAALSYNGRIGFGLLGDHDRVPDLDFLSGAIGGAFDDLVWAGGLDTLAPQEPSLSKLADFAGAHAGVR